MRGSCAVRVRLQRGGGRVGVVVVVRRRGLVRRGWGWYHWRRPELAGRSGVLLRVGAVVVARLWEVVVATRRMVVVVLQLAILRVVVMVARLSGERWRWSPRRGDATRWRGLARWRRSTRRSSPTIAGLLPPIVLTLHSPRRLCLLKGVITTVATSWR